jgi:hypothetical protein
MTVGSAASFSDRPFYRLSRHFFTGFFDLPFLHDRGPETAVRVVIGLLAVILTAGRLLTRMYLTKYVQLDLLPSAEPYRQALLADDTLAIGLPMLVVAFVAVLAGDSLLPDETDFRALRVLPVTDRMIFGAKLAALALFAGLFVAGTHAAMTLFVFLISVGRWAEHNLVSRLAAYAGAGLCGSTFIVLAVVALNGLVVVCIPRGRVYQGAAALRCGLLCALVVAVPFAARIPLLGPSLARGSRLTYAIPPVWFLGIERVLLGVHDRQFVTLAVVGVSALAAAAVVAGVTYVSLYRRFDRVLLRSSAERGTSASALGASAVRRSRGTPGSFAAVLEFAQITLRRSPLHQGVFAGLSACGAGLVVNALAGGLNGWVPGTGLASAALADAILWAPFALMLTTAFALRAAFSLPVDHRANWVFQMTEHADTRAEQLGAGERLLWTAVALPIAIVLPLEWLVFGPRALMCVAIETPYGVLLVELLLSGWQRIPFTCSYLPGKRFIGQTLALGAGAFWAFTGIGTFLARQALSHQGRAVVAIALMTAAAVMLRRSRLNRWRRHPLVFEDRMPQEIEPLSLSAR